MNGDFTLLLPLYGGNSPEQLVEAFESSVARQQLRPDAVVIVEDGPLPPELHRTVDRLADEIDTLRAQLHAYQSLQR